MLGLTGFDFIVIILIGASMLTGFRKGFTTEALKLIAWAGAIFMTVVALPGVAPVIQEKIPIEWLANIISVIITFILSLVALSYLAGFVGGRIRASFIAPIDRALGTAFGFCRGVLVVCGAYLVVTSFYPEKIHPDWMTKGRLYQPVRVGADVIADMTPDLFDNAIDIVKDGGYQDEAREQMDDLIEDVATDDDNDDGN